MSSAPFDIDASLPEDDDIVSQFPANERTNRDIIESWLLVNHNVNGRHDEVQLDYKADPSAPGANITEVWASSTGNAAGALKMRRGTGNTEWIGPPPGVIVDYAGTTEPEGWLFCYGQAISRSTYARLFDILSTTFGVGDGSTTFNLPDLRGRMAAGRDDMGGAAASRITNAVSGVAGTTLGASGGSQAVTLAQANLPNATLTGTTASGGVDHTHTAASDSNTTAGDFFDGGGSFTAVVSTPGQVSGAASAYLHTHTFTTSSINGNVTQTDVNKLSPVLVLNKIIKT